MTIEKPEGVFDLESELDQAREIYLRIKTRMLELQDDLNTSDDPTKAIKNVNQITVEFFKSFNHLTKLGDDLGKQRNVIRGVLQGGALDLEAARTEVLGRITRIRERG